MRNCAFFLLFAILNLKELLDAYSIILEANTTRQKDILEHNANGNATAAELDWLDNEGNLTDEAQLIHKLKNAKSNFSDTVKALGTGKNKLLQQILTNASKLKKDGAAQAGTGHSGA
jgi:hypothetical protein